MMSGMKASGISYDRRGSGPPVVLVHGIGSRWQVFEPVIDLLAATHDVIALDLPGFGASPADAAVDASPPGYARRLVSFFEELGVERPHVVGNSMGGGIAIELGRSGNASQVTAFSPVGFWSTPGRVWCQSLVTAMRLSGTYAGPVLDKLVNSKVARGVLLSAFYGRPTWVTPANAVADTHGLVGSTMFREARDGFTGYVVEGDPSTLLDIPVTIGWGTRDVLLTHRTQSRRARQVLPFARHVDLPGCGHLPFNDDPYLCANVILGKA
ncbi:MAG: alpha/beta hydrolase [Marmoricola sp.]|nr:alpha/beta hydrolase [Marmoricola sp.]